jgi:hypothetical protein
MASFSYATTAKFTDLLNIADPKKSMYLRILSSTRIAIGPDPMKPIAVIDLAKEEILPFSEEPLKATEPAPSEGQWTSNPDEVPGWRSSRKGGEYWFELNGKRSDFHSLRDLLAGGLKALEEARPGTLEKLSHIKPRSRRIVARDPKDLFDKDHLAKDYADKLTDGWYYGTNNSANETNVWLERAASCAGLKWGEEFKTSIHSIDALLDLIK